MAHFALAYIFFRYPLTHAYAGSPKARLGGSCFPGQVQGSDPIRVEEAVTGLRGVNGEVPHVEVSVLALYGIVYSAMP